MKTIEIQDVMKTIDVFILDVDECTLKYLRQFYTQYTDAHDGLREDLLNIVTANEWDNEDADDHLQKLSVADQQTIKEEIEQLAKLAVENDAAYVRFIT